MSKTTRSAAARRTRAKTVAPTPPWRSRIVGHGELPPAQLVAHPQNWRVHPDAQADALAGVLDEVGWVQSVMVNRATGRLVDGHLRVALALKAGATTVPVVYVDLTEAEERLVLATLDPLAALAEPDGAALERLLAEVGEGTAGLEPLLASLRAEAEILLTDGLATVDASPPASVAANVEQLGQVRAARRSGNAAVASAHDTERYLVIVFPSRAAREAAAQALGLPADERYVAASAVRLQARGGAARVTGARPLTAAPAKHSGDQG